MSNMLKRRVRSLERKLRTMDDGAKEEREVLKLYALLNERLDLTEVDISPNTRRSIEYLTLGDILLGSRWLTTHKGLNGIGDKRFQEVMNVVEDTEQYKRVTRLVDDNLK